MVELEFETVGWFAVSTVVHCARLRARHVDFLILLVFVGGAGAEFALGVDVSVVEALVLCYLVDLLGSVGEGGGFEGLAYDDRDWFVGVGGTGSCKGCPIRCRRGRWDVGSHDDICK